MLQIPKEHFMQNGHNKGEKQKQNILRSGGKNTQNCTKKKKKILMTQITVMVSLLT